MIVSALSHEGRTPIMLLEYSIASKYMYDDFHLSG